MSPPSGRAGARSCLRRGVACARNSPSISDIRRFSTEDVVIVNQSGRGDKDIFTVADAFDDPGWRAFIRDKAEHYGA